MNWIAVLISQIEKRKKLELEWIEYRAYVGIDSVVSSLEQLFQTQNLLSDLDYRQFSLRNKVLYSLSESLDLDYLLSLRMAARKL